MDVSAIKTGLQRFGFSDDDPLLTWINASYHEIEESYPWPWLQTSAIVTVAAGVNTVAVPSDFYKLKSLRDTTTENKLQYISFTQFDRDIGDPTDSGPP